MGRIFFKTHSIRAEFEPRLCDLFKTYLEGNGEPGVRFDNGSISFDEVAAIEWGQATDQPVKTLGVYFSQHEKPAFFSLDSPDFESWYNFVAGGEQAAISSIQTGYRFVINPKMMKFAQLKEPLLIHDPDEF